MTIIIPGGLVLVIGILIVLGLIPIAILQWISLRKTSRREKEASE